MKHSKLDATNSDHLTYQHPPLDIAVLGGIRLEGLDRMRATLKVQLEHLAIRHNLDLYNDTQVEKLIRKIAERLEIGTSVAASALSDLTDQLERYRLEEIERQQTEHDVERRFLTPEEIKTTKIYASAPNLMQRTGDDLQATGIIGEWENALTLTGALLGGGSAALTGGNFWQGAATGATVSVANHWVHRFLSDIKHSQQLPTSEEIRAKYGDAIAEWYEQVLSETIMMSNYEKFEYIEMRIVNTDFNSLVSNPFKNATLVVKDFRIAEVELVPSEMTRSGLEARIVGLDSRKVFDFPNYSYKYAEIFSHTVNNYGTSPDILITTRLFAIPK